MGGAQVAGVVLAGFGEQCSDRPIHSEPAEQSRQPKEDASAADSRRTLPRNCRAKRERERTACLQWRRSANRTGSVDQPGSRLPSTGHADATAAAGLVVVSRWILQSRHWTTRALPVSGAN